MLAAAVFMSAIGDPTTRRDGQRLLLVDSPVRRGSGWINRAWAAITAELELIDCASLDVLLLCTDDVAARAPPAQQTL